LVPAANPGVANNAESAIAGKVNFEAPIERSQREWWNIRSLLT
jgi:hypothetical protein